MLLNYLILAVALSLSAVAAFYSIMGLTAIFAAAVVPIVVMGTMLEMAKLVVTVWLHEHWHQVKFTMKAYLVPAVGVLMLITSMGIFGFLSKAHSDQGLVSSDVQSQLAVYDEKIKTLQDNIVTNRKVTEQMDSQVDQILGRTTDERGASKAATMRKSQSKERTRLQMEIQSWQNQIQKINEERAPVAASVRRVEAEVGPIRYVAALIYGDEAGQYALERAVRWVIIMLVLVFDPLAIMMLLAFTEGQRWNRDRGSLQPEKILQHSDQDLAKIEPQTRDSLPEHEENIEPIDNPTTVETEMPLADLATTDQDVLQDESLDENVDDKQAMKLWKQQNPDHTLKEQRSLLAQGLIDRLPWEELSPIPDNHTGGYLGYGKEFPQEASKGDLFVLTLRSPNVLYKFNGSKWIEVDKTLTDTYTYDTAYIDYLIEQLQTGNLEPDSLTAREAEQISNRLDSTTGL